MFQVIAAA